MNQFSKSIQYKEGDIVYLYGIMYKLDNNRFIPLKEE